VAKWQHCFADALSCYFIVDILMKGAFGHRQAVYLENQSVIIVIFSLQQDSMQEKEVDRIQGTRNAKKITNFASKSLHQP